MEKQELAAGLERDYPLQVFSYYYQHYWRDLALARAKLRQKVSGKGIPGKSVMATLFAEVLLDPELSKAFFKKLPEGTSQLLQYITWEGPLLIDDLEKDGKIKVAQDRDKCCRYEEPLLPQYRIFQIWNPYPPFYHYHQYDHINLPDSLRRHLKSVLPKPANYDIRESEEPAQNSLRHQEENIFQILEIGRFFIEGDHIKYATQGDKILKSSLKKFANQASIQEFFESDLRDLQFAKAELILEVYGDILGKDAPHEPLALLKYLVSQIFEKNKLGFAPLLLTHLKGSLHLRDLPEWENTSIPAGIIRWILSQMPLHGWVSVKNIMESLNYRDIDQHFFNYLKKSSELFIYTKESFYRQKLHVTAANINVLMVQPLLHGIMFLLSALGLLEIAYGLPENSIITQELKDYLSVYDGLTHIKLTPLGAFVFGRSEHYDGPATTTSRGEVVVDDKGLILTLKGTDTLKAMVLEQLGNPIGGNRFKVDFGSFLKGCRSQTDVKSQISRFRNEICKQPPPIWETFFKTTLQRVGPLTRSQEWEVYRVEPSPEIINLLATDPLLKSHVLKAEDYHLLIRPGDRRKVVRRLEECGFLITDL